MEHGRWNLDLEADVAAVPIFLIDADIDNGFVHCWLLE